MKKNNQKGPNTINAILINNQKWFGFFLVWIFLFSMFIYFILKSSNIRDYIFSSVLFVLFLYGMYIIFIQEKRLENAKIKLINIDIVYTILGSFSTYLMTMFLPISSIIASATIGLIGYLIFKKNSFAIYCGSFVGMTSASIFGYYELLLASFLCGIIFVIVKPILNGYGGRLGTIAFISTVIVAFFFNGSSLAVESNFSIFLVFLVGVVGVVITFIFQNYLKQSVVIASALPSLIFSIFIEIFFPNSLVYSAVFFTASFLGMADSKRIENIFSALITGVILSIIFLSFFNYFNGLGGKMGMSAFVSLVVYQGLKNLIIKIIKPKKNEDLISIPQ